jgi:two-component system chemotaxis sensor kinase CheA
MAGAERSPAQSAASLDLSQFFQVFFEEAAEHLAEMENLLLGLDPANAADEDLNAIFRAAHSIKGGSGTFGFTDMTRVTHELESLLDRARKHELVLTVDMVDALLAAGDVLKAQLARHRGQTDENPFDVDACCLRIRALAAGNAAAASPAPPPATTLQPLEIRFPNPRSRTGKKAVEDAIRELGMLGTLTQLAPPKGKAGERALLLHTDAGADDIRNLLGFAVAPEKIRIALTDAALPEHPAPTRAAAADDAGFGLFDDAPGAPADPGYGLFDDAPGTPAAHAAADPDPGYGFFEPLNPPQAGTAAAAPERRADMHGRRATDRESEPVIAGRREADRATTPAASAEMTSIRVGVEKVDQLINLIGELVITQAMLAQTVATQVATQEQGGSVALGNGMAQLERNTRDLQEAVMSIRMMPISFVFNRFPRVVRDLAAKLGKQVTLATVGEGTEIDKGLIEKLADPLTHLVRNSLDHGIETPDVRVAAGKPAGGTITLQAFHQGGSIILEISDDGAGLNRRRILDKAAERGLPVHDRMTDQQVWQLIFEAGFSTAAVVTDVSGRGVGMDVVKRNIHALGGRIEIHSTEGAGTKIAIRLPLTLAILDGMSVQVGDELYIFPLTCIVESMQPDAASIKSMAGQGLVVEVRGDYLPIVPLHDFFGIKPHSSKVTDGILVIIESNQQKTAVLVDALIGQHQVVIKSLETNYRKVRGISGATIMGDGRVAMILDAAAIANLAADQDGSAATETRQ